MSESGERPCSVLKNFTVCTGGQCMLWNAAPLLPSFWGAFHAYEARVKIFNRYGANPSHTLIWVNANGITLESSR